MDAVVERFLKYIKCSSESRFEKDFCLLIENDLEEMNVFYERQFLDNNVQTNGWNILAKVDGTDAKLKPYLFVFHLDTVSPGGQINPIIENGIIKSDGRTVLGADGKLAIAIVLETIANLKKLKKIKRSIEILFTVCQEMGLLGSKYGDYSNILSEEAIVIDHYKSGYYLKNTPSVVELNVEIIGKSSHVIRKNITKVNSLKAGVEIIHRMDLGRINENLVVNVSDFVSLSALNIIPKFTRFDIEIRSFDKAIIEHTLNEIKNIINSVCLETGCEKNIKEFTKVSTTNYEKNLDIINKIKKIGKISDFEIKGENSFGYLDSINTNEIGIKSIALGVNIQNSHSVREYVVIEDILKMETFIKNLILNY